jgi:serine O-acetyltransferase
MSLWTRIRDDIRFAQERDPAATSLFEVVLAYPGVHALLLHRLAHQLCHWRVRLLPRLISHFNRGLTGIEIHPGAEIASPCFIDHGMGVVIGETTVVGKRCHLHQGVTLGGTSTRREKRHPTLRDDVTVGAGAQIVGAITIGKGAKIGAGSVVVANVPDYATVVGVPGHVVAYYDPGNDTILRLPDPEHDRIEELEKRVIDLEDEVAAALHPPTIGSDEAAPDPLRQVGD